MKKGTKKGDFSKAVVRFCLVMMTITLFWAMTVTTVASVTGQMPVVSDVLVFAGAFYGGELCLLCLKRILAKERDLDEHNTDSECPDSADFGTGIGFPDSMD